MKTLQIHTEDAPALALSQVRWRWASRLDHKQEVVEMVAGELLARGWVLPDERHWIHLCLDEAVVNAMLHGNEGDARLDIEVTIGGDERTWVVIIRDQGLGFTLADIPDPEHAENLLLEHGRGIRIMQEWLDDLRYYRKGACIWMSPGVRIAHNHEWLRVAWFGSCRHHCHSCRCGGGRPWSLGSL